MSNSEEPPHLKRKEEPPHEKRKEEASLKSSLPEDVALNCLARVSRLDHAALSLASKSYRSLVASPYLFMTRALMDRTETYVYVCLRTPPPDPKPRWFILRRRKTLDASSADLIPIPSLPSQPPEGSSVVVLGWGIFVIGGLINGAKRTSDFWLLDCRTHTWRRLPSMRVARAYAAAGIVDGKIYVIGGCVNDWGEVFDLKTLTWDMLPPMPERKGFNKSVHDCVVKDEKVYVVDGTDRTFYYSPSQGQWGTGSRGHQVKGNPRDWCMIDDDLIYCLCRNGTISWCEPDELDSEGMVETKEVKGLGSLKKTLLSSRVVHFSEQLLDLWERKKVLNGLNPQRKNIFHELEDLLPGARLSNSGGNIVLFWDVVQGDRLEIWCAEISLERSQEGEIWGNIEWSNAVMTVDPFLGRYKLPWETHIELLEVFEQKYHNLSKTDKDDTKETKPKRSSLVLSNLPVLVCKVQVQSSYP